MVQGENIYWWWWIENLMWRYFLLNVICIVKTAVLTCFIRHLPIRLFSPWSLLQEVHGPHVIHSVVRVTFSPPSLDTADSWYERQSDKFPSTGITLEFTTATCHNNKRILTDFFFLRKCENHFLSPVTEISIHRKKFLKRTVEPTRTPMTAPTGVSFI